MSSPQPICFRLSLCISSTTPLCLKLNWKLILHDFLFWGKFMWLLCAGFLHIGGICNIICEAIHFAPAVLSNICRKKVPTHRMEDIIFSGMASNKYGFSTSSNPAIYQLNDQKAFSSNIDTTNQQLSGRINQGWIHFWAQIILKKSDLGGQSRQDYHIFQIFLFLFVSFTLIFCFTIFLIISLWMPTKEDRKVYQR